MTKRKRTLRERAGEKHSCPCCELYGPPPETPEPKTPTKQERDYFNQVVRDAWERVQAHRREQAFRDALTKEKP